VWERLDSTIERGARYYYQYGGKGVQKVRTRKHYWGDKIGRGGTSKLGGGARWEGDRMMMDYDFS